MGLRARARNAAACEHAGEQVGKAVIAGDLGRGSSAPRVEPVAPDPVAKGALDAEEAVAPRRLRQQHGGGGHGRVPTLR